MCPPCPGPRAVPGPPSAVGTSGCAPGHGSGFRCWLLAPRLPLPRSPALRPSGGCKHLFSQGGIESHNPGDPGTHATQRQVAHRQTIHRVLVVAVHDVQNGQVVVGGAWYCTVPNTAVPGQARRAFRYNTHASAAGETRSTGPTMPRVHVVFLPRSPEQVVAVLNISYAFASLHPRRTAVDIHVQPALR